MAGLLGNFVESLMFQLSDNGLHRTPSRPQWPYIHLSRNGSCIVPVAISLIARSVSAPTLLHFQFFTSCTYNNPTRKCCSVRLSVEPSQEHKSSFIAFYRLLHHRKRSVECTEMVTVSFLFSYWLFANNNFAQYYHLLAGVCNYMVSSSADLSFKPSGKRLEVIIPWNSRVRYLFTIFFFFF